MALDGKNYRMTTENPPARPSTVRRGLAWTMGRVLSARGISLLRTLVLARLLAPRDFGLFSAAVVTISLFEALSHFGFDAALVQSETADDRRGQVAWTLGVTRGALVSLVGVVTAPAAAHLFGEPDAEPLIAVFALAPFLTSLQSVGLVLRRRVMDFRPTVLTALSESVLDIVIAVALARSLGAWALVWGALGGRLGAIAASYVLAPLWPRLRFDREVARSFVGFGRYILLATIAGVAADAFLQSLVSRTLGAGALGVFFMARRIGQLPNELIGDPISSVVMSEQSRLAAKPELAARSVARALVLGWSALTPASLLLAVLAGPLVLLVLGATWLPILPLLPLLLFEGWIGLATDVAVPTLRARDNTRAEMVAQLLRAGVIVALGVALIGTWGLLGPTVAFLFGGLASAAAGSYLAHRRTAVMRRPLLADLSVVAAAALGGSAVAWLLAARVFEIDGTAGGNPSFEASVAGLGQLAVCLASGLLVSAVLWWSLDVSLRGRQMRRDALDWLGSDPSS